MHALSLGIFSIHGSRGIGVVPSVVASRVDGLDEIVVDGVTGLLVTPEDPSELAAALDRLSAEPALVGEFGRSRPGSCGRFHDR